MTIITKYVTSFLVLVLICLAPTLPVYAKVKGQCASCHTMHNSQDNKHMMINEVIDGTGGSGGVLLNDGSYPALTRGSCVGCHTGENTGSSTTPYVYNTGSVSYETDTLAGGNFKWVLEDDRMGHNVSGIPGMGIDEALINGAPGDVGNAGLCSESCHKTLFDPEEAEGVALATGCEGCHLATKHHATQQTTGDPALEANGYFRFLSGHNGGFGVHGIEAEDWELNANATNHNEYLGESASGVTDHTMTAYCVGCHGHFHSQKDGNGKWIRHPSDGVLPTTGEYTAYSLYDPSTPIARPDLSAIGSPDQVRAGTDMVMCLSCHRAHGSPYPDMLRWSYTGMVAGSGSSVGDAGAGCMKCHSEKN